MASDVTTDAFSDAGPDAGADRNLISADKVQGTAVYNHDDEKLGTIDSIYIDKRNGEVAYDGGSYYFSYDSARTIDDIAADPKVALSFQANKSLLRKPGIMIAVEGVAELVRDKARFAEHWTAGLDRWFPQGTDTPGLVMIEVRASRIHYWDGEDEGEIKV